MKINLVIFDMDGLMFDTEKLSYEGWSLGCSRYGYKLTDDFFKTLVACNMKVIEHRFCKHFGEDTPYKQIESIWDDYIVDTIKEKGIPVKKGLLELLDYLDEKGIHKAVASSSDRTRVELCIKSANIMERFDCIICGSDIKRGKPEPDIFLTAAERLNCAASECAVLEDSENGILAASRAGMMPIMVPDLIQPSDETKKLYHKKLDSLLDVRDYFMKINAAPNP
ncbi:MAG: HAD family phosphatase [Bacillota bacterium]|nr:HAD family phosphatase [Bacillota bacterium]